MTDATKIIVSKLKESLFRHNNEKNTSYTVLNAPLDLVSQLISLPSFILNAINFANIKSALDAQMDENSKTVLVELTQIVEPKLCQAKDHLSYWLMDVEPCKLISLIQYCEANKLDLAEFDCKLRDTLNKYRIYMDAGIKTHQDLVEYIANYQAAHTDPNILIN